MPKTGGSWGVGTCVNTAPAMGTAEELDATNWTGNTNWLAYMPAEDQVSSSARHRNGTRHQSPTSPCCQQLQQVQVLARTKMDQLAGTQCSRGAKEGRVFKGRSMLESMKLAIALYVCIHVVYTRIVPVCACWEYSFSVTAGWAWDME